MSLASRRLHSVKRLALAFDTNALQLIEKCLLGITALLLRAELSETKFRSEFCSWPYNF
jgi:hypothetical protein